MNYKSLLDRRSFLKLGLSGALAALSAQASQAALKKTNKDAIQLPLTQYVAKKYENLLGGPLKGISDEQLKAHFKLYEGYISKINELEARIKDFDTKETDTINYRGWHLEQTSNL